MRMRVVHVPIVVALGILLVASCGDESTSSESMTHPDGSIPQSDAGLGNPILQPADSGAGGQDSGPTDSGGGDSSGGPNDSGMDATAGDSGTGDGGGGDGGSDAAADSGTDASACVAKAPCDTNPGAMSCRAGEVQCNGNVASCVDGPEAIDGAACTSGLCARGVCLPPSTIAASIDITALPIAQGRSCGEAAAFSVTALTANDTTLSQAASACLAQGDEVLLINLQGAPGATDNVGNWELLKIASVVNNTVTFGSAKTRSYGATAGSDVGVGVGPTDQKVALIRVPQFGALTVAADTTVKAAPWNGLLGGVVALRAAKLTLEGTISAAGLGYRGGRWSRDDGSCSDNVDTEPGESISGVAVPGTSNNVGGAGGISGATSISFNDNTPLQSGASHASLGAAGQNGNGRTVGGPGATYGVNDASKLTMGSGEGGNLTCEGGTFAPDLFVVGNRLAGGIVLLLTGKLDVGPAGSISASASAAGRDVSASGGYVFLRGGTLNLGTDHVTAEGGTGNGGSTPTMGLSVKAGDGYITLKATTFTGTTVPSPNPL